MRYRYLALILALAAVAGLGTFRVAQSAMADDTTDPMAASFNIDTPAPGTPPYTPTPTSQAPSFITNDSGQTAVFVYVWGSGSFGGATGPFDCGTPVYSQTGSVNNPDIPAFGWRFAEVLWVSPCVDPQVSNGVGEKVTLSFGSPFPRLFGFTFRPSFVTEKFTNTESTNVNQLNAVPVQGSIGQPFIVAQPATCKAPEFEYKGQLNQGDIDIIWPTACIRPGEQVTLHFVGAEPSHITPHSWSLDTGVGGVAELADGALANPAAEPAASNHGERATVLSAAAAFAVLAGAWLTLRRRADSSS